MPVLFGPDGKRPTPNQIASQLFETFSVIDADPLFKSWCDYNSIGVEEARQAFKAALTTKEFKEARQAKNAKPAAISLDDFLRLDFPEPEWLANKVIPQGGLVAISGKPGSYKSFFALWLAMRVAAGLPLFEDLETEFFCKQDTNQTPVMFIEEENSAILMHKRAKGLRVVPGSDCYVRIDQGFKFTDESWRRTLLEDVATKGIGMIVVDPFSSVMGLQNENDNAEVAVVMDLIRKEFIMKGITVVFIHHPAKGDDSGKTLRGAGDILGKCDVHLHFEKDAADKRLITLSYEKMRLIADDEVTNFKMRLTGDPFCRDARFRYLGEAKPKHEVEREQLAKQIKESMVPGENYQKSKLAENVGKTFRDDRFKAAWELLEKNNEIKTCLETKNGHPLFRLG